METQIVGARTSSFNKETSLINGNIPAMIAKLLKSKTVLGPRWCVDDFFDMLKWHHYMRRWTHTYSKSKVYGTLLQITFKLCKVSSELHSSETSEVCTQWNISFRTTLFFPVLVYVNKFIREKVKLHEMKNAKNMWVFLHTESNNLAQLGLGDFPWLMHWTLLRICLRTH